MGRRRVALWRFFLVLTLRPRIAAINATHGGHRRSSAGNWHVARRRRDARRRLAACSGQPNTASPQAMTKPTLAPTGHLSALGDLNGLAPAQVAALIGDPDLR